jgi:phage portal protein BeeE
MGTHSFSEPAAPVAVSGADASAPSASLYRSQSVAIQIAMSIPAMRRAHHLITGLPATWPLYAQQDGSRVSPTDPRAAWLRQPDPLRTRAWLITKTLDDAMWYDRSVWQFERNIAGQASRFRRVHPDRYSTIDEPGDPDTVAAWVVDGVMLSPSEFRTRYLAFEWGGIGGLRRFGAPMLSLYADLQAAAGNYARAPHPKAILKNNGPDLDDDEIDALLADWEAARATRSVGYLNSTVDYEDHGWNAQELQLVEGREHAALEVARLTGLPAAAVDAKTGGSMTYGNIVEYRRDLREALRPWTDPIVDTLSLDDRTGTTSGLILPRGMTAGFDDVDYLREAPLTRMQTWQAGITAGVIDLEDARTQEPLNRK